MNVIEKSFVYVNGFVEALLFDPLLKEFVDLKLGKDDWKVCKNNLKDIPERLEEFVTPDFLHGICASQYLDVMGGGTFINPFVPGMTAEYGVWADIIFKEEFMPHEIKFLDVPYDLYQSIVPQAKLVTEEEYNINNEYTEKLVTLLNEQSPPNRILH